MANMERIRILFAVVAVTTVAAACVPLGAQSAAVSGTPQIETEAARELGRQQPRVPGAGTSEQVDSIELRSPEQMSQADRNLVAQAQPAIAERASFAGMEFDRGKWDFQQLMCPALPNHVLLRFTRDGGAGDVSVFSASIPRGGTGRVRVIPIQRRGYSLFSPAPVNALTIYTFNRILGEEPAEPAPALLTTGLCYAALAGASPKVAPLDAGQSISETLTIPDHPGVCRA
jgi:hypothetical protein